MGQQAKSLSGGDVEDVSVELHPHADFLTKCEARDRGMSLPQSIAGSPKYSNVLSFPPPLSQFLVSVGMSTADRRNRHSEEIFPLNIAIALKSGGMGMPSLVKKKAHLFRKKRERRMGHPAVF